MQIITTILATFESTHDAIFCESVLQNQKCARIVSLPTSISASCGLALQIEQKGFESAKQIIENNNISTTFYLVNSLGLEKIITKI